MIKTINRLIALGTAAAVVMLAGCGSGNKEGGALTAAPASVTTVSGVAATGAPIVGTIRLKDSSTPSRELTAPSGSDGAFSFNVDGLTPPFILRAEWTAGGGTQSLLSFSAAAGTANITPFSNAIVANAAGVNDPAPLYDSFNAAMQQQIAKSLAGSASSLQAQLKPLLDLYGVTADLMTGTFVANHTGLDALMDAVKVEIANGTMVVTNKSSNAMIFSAPVSSFTAGTFNRMGMPAASQVPNPPAVDGAALYTANCAGCHGTLAASSKKGATVARIQGAINNGIGGMGSLSTLTATEVQAISNALGGAPAPSTTPVPGPAPVPTPAPMPTPAPTSIDGAALYAANCAGCHGALASSSKKGITLARLQSAISGNIGGMGYLSSLSSAQQQAIVNALAVSAPAPAPSPSPAPAPAPAPAPSPTPVDGATLYANNCASCHGPLATSSKRGATLARLQSAISGNVGGMGYLSSLSAADVQAIINALAVSSPAPAPAPTDGATLYGTYCAGCHGTLAKSSVRGSSASSIQSAITGNKGGMGYLSTLTATQIQNIANALR